MVIQSLSLSLLSAWRPWLLLLLLRLTVTQI
jgi:hypothetical protein